MTLTLEIFLAILLLILIVILIVLTIFIVEFLKETTKTMVSLRELTIMAKEELKPALESVNNILSTVNNVSSATNKQFELVKKILTTLLGASCVAFGNVKDKGFFSGIISGFNFFRKKRR